MEVEVEPGKAKRRVLVPEKLKQVVELDLAGISMRDISKITGISRPYVRYMLLYYQAGIKGDKIN